MSIDGELTVTRGTPVAWSGPTVPDTNRPATDFPVETALHIRAIVDHTHARGVFPWMSRWWREGEFLIPFRADLDDPTWGLVMTELFAHLGNDDDHSAAQILARAVEKHETGIHRWSLFPGVQFEGEDTRITPGCCASLNGWWTLRETPEAFLLGHDPLVTARFEGGLVVLRSAMPAYPGTNSTELVSEPDYLVCTRERWDEALDELAVEMDAVARRLAQWSVLVGADGTLAGRLESVFRSEFVG